MADTNDTILTDDEFAAIRAQLRASYERRGYRVEDAPQAIQMSDAALAFAERAHTGLLVALWLDPETAGTLALDGGEPADNLHITLAYAGGVDDLGELAVARAVAAVEREVSWREPLTGKVGGYGRFMASDTSDGQDVFYAAVDVPGLAELRQAVTWALIESGCAPSAKHGFTPHITLAYIDSDAGNPVDRLPATDLTFSGVTVAAGERRIEIPFSPPVAMFALRDDRNDLHIYQPITFAEPPEWSPFLPVPGVYHHPIYGELDFTAETYDRIIANFRSGVYQDKLPVNAEHDPHAAGAVGWIVDLRLAESGAIEARVEWNERGRRLIEGDRYKYVSAEVMPVWADPVDPERRYEDVAVGLALTTHPYFKERVLPPLAASEAVLTPSAGESGKEMEMSEETTQPTAEQAEEQPEVTQTPAAAKGDKNPTVTEMNEEVLREFNAMKAELAEKDRLITKLSESQKALQGEFRKKRFTDEVRGRSDENNLQWIGDIDKHVKHLCDLADKFGETSEQVTHYIRTNREHAEQVKASNLFKEFGTGRAPEGTGQARIDAAVEALMANEKGLTRQQAADRVLRENPGLYSDYLNGR